tara:strand:+ start:471 stop:806 length:336 start_codon:yes stop_codon:yes gene_type:complete
MSIYRFTELSYFFEEEYKEIKVKYSPLQKTANQVKLMPLQYTEKVRYSKQYDKVKVWHSNYKLEINYIYRKFINIIKNTKIVMNTTYENIYTDFVYMLYFNYHSQNIHLKD